MTEDELRRTCREFYDTELSPQSRSVAIEALARLCNRMQAVGLREVADHAAMERLKYVYNVEKIQAYDSINNWARAKAKAREE